MKRSSFIFAIIWLSLAFGIYTLVDNIQNPNKAFRLGDNAKEVVLKRGLDGHYRAEALLTIKK